MIKRYITLTDDCLHLRNKITDDCDAFIKLTTASSLFSTTAMQIEKKEFSKKIYKSYKLLQNKFRYQYLVLLLNDIAEEWDNIIAEKRSEPNEEVSLRPFHRFFLGFTSNKNAPVVEKFMKFLPPDERLSFIQCNKLRSHKHQMLSVLHEIGHFIGNRNRDTRFSYVYFPILTDMICNELFNRICCIFFKCEKIQSAASLRKEQLFDSSVRNTANDIHKSIYRLEKELLDTLRSTYERIKNASILEIQSNIDLLNKGVGDEKIKERQVNILERQIIAIKRSYFMSCGSIVLQTIKCVFEDVDDRDSFCKKLYQELYSNERLQDVPELEVTVTNCCHQIYHSIQRSEIIRGDLPDWFKDAEQILEETVADIFMLRLGLKKPNFDKYVDLLVRTLQKKYETQNWEQLISAISLPANRLRIISVCFAMGIEKQDFKKKKCDTLIKKMHKIGFMEDHFQRIRAFEYIESEYITAYEIAKVQNQSPLDIATNIYSAMSPKTESLYFEYVKSIWKKYDQTFDERKDNKMFFDAINQIRKEQKFYSPIISMVRYVLKTRNKISSTFASTTHTIAVEK